jgi:hypothetical protein
MRFLYGDSAPFPLGYNFLKTLEAFMAAATRIVQLEHESREISRQNDELAQNRVRGLDALDQFHTVVMRAVTDTAQKVQHSHALDYAQRVSEFASRYVEDHKQSTLSANELEANHVRMENERRTGEQRRALETFLRVASLPVLTSRLTMRSTIDGKDAHAQMIAVFDNPDGIQTAFALAPSKVPGWGAPRKISEILQGVELMVGVEKSWLRGTVTPKQVNVDDWFIVEFEASESAFELVLRRRLTEKESVAFHLRRTEVGLVGHVEHPGVPTAEGPTTLGPPDLAQLEQLWLALRTASRDVLEHKEQLLSVSLDGQPVFEAGLVLPFIVRLVSMFAPTVREIANRSPNEFELSLKMETEGGRREEIYLRKDQLVNQLHPLPSSGRAVFEPLGLDTWVPGTTSAPPPVAMPLPPSSSPPISEG